MVSEQDSKNTEQNANPAVIVTGDESVSFGSDIPCVLIAEDDETARMILQKAFSKQPCRVQSACDGKECLELMNEDVSVVLLDLMMPKLSGFECMEVLKREYPDVQIVVISSCGVPEAVKALQMGAFSYVQKPVVLKEVLTVMKKAYEHYSLLKENRKLKQLNREGEKPVHIVGKSEKTIQLLNAAIKAASRECSILIHGETGSGRSTLAKFIHQRSQRGDLKPWVVNCASGSSSDLEQLLLGVDYQNRDTFAVGKPGYIELADGSSLILENIDRLPPSLQRDLLQIASSWQVSRIGSSQIREVNLRIIATTIRPKEYFKESSDFLSDLYYALNFFHLVVPSLSERKEDIPEIVSSILEEFCEKGERYSITEEALNLLVNSDWRGNIKELKNTLRNSGTFCKDFIITKKDLSS